MARSDDGAPINMYQPAYHREDRLEVQQSLIESHPFGLLISRGVDGIEANGVSFVLDRHQGQSGVLKAQIARTNFHWKVLDEQEVLVVFQGPLSYVTPAFYETKKQTGKVVPTWNYVMVQARGVAKLHEVFGNLPQQINNTVNEQDRTHSAAVRSSSDVYMQYEASGIVGIEIPIVEISGKWKVNQDEHDVDRRSAADGFAHDNPEMATLIRTYGQL